MQTSCYVDGYTLHFTCEEQIGHILARMVVRYPNEQIMALLKFTLGMENNIVLCRKSVRRKILKEKEKLQDS
jgi:hypothetical protein